MKRALGGAVSIAALGAVTSCGSAGESPVVSARSSLPAGAAARVGDELIARTTVEAVAQRQALSPREALTRVVADAAWALGGRAAAPPGVASSLERAAAARALLEHLARDAEAAGPPTSAEIAELVAERWAELARPPAARVTHAVVINADPLRDAAARARAEAILSAVRDANSTEAFVAAARGVPKEGFDVRVEALPAVTADGRTFEQRDRSFVELPSKLDLDFARGAITLREPGSISPVVKSAFGYHVLRLEQRFPEHFVPAAELPALLGVEIRTRRALRLRRELLDQLRGPAQIAVQRSADELTARVGAAP